MSEDLELLRERFITIVNNSQTLAFIARDTSLQNEAISQSAEFGAELEASKAIAAASNDEATANEVLLMELALGSVASQLKMCVAIKEEEAEKAWDYLVDAQTSCQAAIKVRRQLDSGPGASNLEQLLAWLLQIEAAVFPQQAFLSIGGTVRRRDCSICGGAYDACEHVKGRAYMGRLCHTIISEMSLAEVSLVDNPANKRARVTHFSDGEKRRNKMTWRLEEPSHTPLNSHST
jgi:hypothetical protein